MKELTWVMPNYILNKGLLELAIEAAKSFKEAEPGSDLMVIDDGSPYSTAPLRELADVYVRTPNRGFVRTVNTGLKLADTLYIAVVNNDIRVAPNVFKVAKEVFDKDGNVCSVHPRMLPYDQPFEYKKQDWLTGKERWCQSSCFFMNMPGYTFPEHFKGSGGGYEDWYFWSKVRRDGWYTAYTNRTCFQHRDSSTTQLVGEENKKHTENRELFRKEFGDYPEEYFAKRYPEQMKQDWKEGFE